MARILLPMLLLGLLLAGCTESHNDGAAANDGSGASGNTTALKVPVSISDGGEMTQAGAKDYTWNVTPGFTTFVVTVTLAGPNGAPLYASTGLGYVLEGGAKQMVYAEQAGGPTNANVAAGSAGAQPLTFNAASENDKAALAGDWHLHLDWQPSPAHYDVAVTVRY